MDKVKARMLKPYEKHKLKRMKRQLTNSVNCLHARIILLSRGGYTNRQIAEQCGCTPTWVRKIIHRFNQGGIDAIGWYPYYCARAGPRKFFADLVEQICEVALSPPKRLIGMSVWSLEKLREYWLNKRLFLQYPWNGFGNCCADVEFAGVTPRAGKIRTIRNSGPNIGVFGDFMASGPKVDDAFVLTNSAR